MSRVTKAERFHDRLVVTDSKALSTSGFIGWQKHVPITRDELYPQL